MPLIQSRYQGPPFYLFNKHIETIYPSMMRKIKGVNYEREKIETPDDDFLNIDWVKGGNQRLLVVSHGLEGGSNRHYVKGLVKLFVGNGWDVVAWNNRTCNGEMNRQKVLYHHAASYDLRTVVNHALLSGDYEEVALAGISMGGGQTIRYLGELDQFPLPAQVRSAVAISAPCYLPESVETLYQRENRLYEQRFLKKLILKIKAKALQFTEIDLSGIDDIASLQVFDERYSAPLNGFSSAKDFYEYCNPYPFLEKLDRPCLIINALNDPLLKGRCYPYEMAQKNPSLFLETPERGGHVGFLRKGEEFTYSEIRAFEFINEKQF